MRTLAPGLYALAAIYDSTDEDDNDIGRAFCTNLGDAFNRFDDEVEVVLPEGFQPPVGIVDSPVGPAGTLILTLDLGDGTPMTDTSVNSPLGPLSISRNYAVFPTESRELCDEPGGQYATNWLILEIERDTVIAVDGGRILIDGQTVNVGAGPDYSIGVHHIGDQRVEWGWAIAQGRTHEVVTTYHVARVGTETHDLLRTMLSGEDDGVLGFFQTDEAGLAKLSAIDCPAAREIAAEMRANLAERDHCGTVLHIQVDGKVPSEA